MDTATLTGIIFGIICIVVPILIGGDAIAFYDFQSILIVLGGGMASALISYRMDEATKILKVAVQAFLGKNFTPEKTIKLLVDLSQKARRDGLLSLEAEMENISDEFLKQSIQLVVDGVEPEIIVETMDLELENMESRHKKGQGLFKTLGNMFPAWGMIGTLIGLILLLRSLDDPSKIGPAMAVALVTTFYGSVLANMVCLPIAQKLSLNSQQELQEKRMIIEGILSIQAGENPRIMEHKLKTFLSPQQKQNYAKMLNENNEGREETSREGFGSTIG